jgi:serine/threonine protein kinase/Flp pilus assembly protein TadD
LLPAAECGQPAGISSSAAVAGPIEQMVAAWRRGERPRAEEFLAQHPDLGDEDAVRLIYEEACLRQEAGEESVSAEILHRFPRWRSKLALLLDCQKLFWAPPPKEASFPEVGQDLGDFRILAEIGRGAHGRTFLASQASLAHRPLVLKITPMGHDEHLSLARLQHMHIVSLYFEQVLPDCNLRVLGMPYLGGATLGQILESLRAAPVAERTGRHILEALERCNTAGAVPTEYPTNGPFRNFLAQASYVQAVCWVGACLADALQYAHDRGLVHMDVKPANVLIAGDGQPMLLDFHLARGLFGPGFDLPDRLGGTPGYLSPEQRDAMAAINQGKAIPTAVDGRSDIYSLGLLLYEALGGEEAPGSAPSYLALEKCNPRVSPGLSDIVRKCLAQNPGDRYSTAAAMAQDLRLHLNDQPLRGVANRSSLECWRKWRRRSPAALGHTLFWIAALAAVVAILGISGVRSRQRPRQIEAALVEGREHIKKGRYHEATLALDRGLDLAAPLLDQDPQKRALKTELQRVLFEQAAAELHTLVNLLRFRSGISPPDDNEAEVLYRRGRQVWNRRSLLLRHPGGVRPDQKAEQTIHIDLLDLATVLADLRVHGGTNGANSEAVREAARILRDAEQQFGPSPALCRDLRAYNQLPGRTEVAASAVPSPRTAWEHYDLGRSFLRTGEHARAAEEFRLAVDQEPGEFWLHFFEAVCADRLGRYQDALAALNICVALAPGTAECYYDRAKVHEALGQLHLAERDYARALELNPRFSDAALNRATLAFRAGRYSEAIADLEYARKTAAGPRALGLIAYNLALVHAARNDWPAARASLRQAIASGNAAARELAPRFDLH